MMLDIRLMYSFKHAWAYAKFSNDKSERIGLRVPKFWQYTDKNITEDCYISRISRSESTAFFN